MGLITPGMPASGTGVQPQNEWPNWWDKSQQAAIGNLQMDLSARGVNVKAAPYHAKGDWNGTTGTDETAAIQAALDDAYTLGLPVWIPNGTYRVRGVLTVRTSIGGTGTLLFDRSTTGYLLIPVGYDGITIQGITVDGNTLSTSPYTGNQGIVNRSNDVHIFNVKTRNTNGAGIRNESGHRLKVAYCDIRYCRNTFGDGIYNQVADDCVFAYNYIYDVMRIGIVCDSAGVGKCKNPLIIGNQVSYAHGSLNGELNGGIWLENTLGGKITHNVTKQTAFRGIVVVPLIDDGLHYHYLVEGNTIIDPVGTGIAVGDGSTTTPKKTLADVDIRNNEIRGSYNVGISHGIHCNVIIDQVHFGNGNVQALILTDMLGYVEKVTLQISRCSKGTITYQDTTVKDIHLFNKGLMDVTIQDLIGVWGYDMPSDQIIGTLKGENTSFLFDSSATSYLCNFATGGGVFRNCEFILNTSQAIQCNSPVLQFDSCYFHSADTTVRSVTMTYQSYDNRYNGCRFQYANILDYTEDATGNYVFTFRDCKFVNYGSSGALNTSLNAHTSNKWRVLECEFYDSGSANPMKKGTVSPSQIVFRNTISPTASACGSGLAATSEVNTLVVT